MSESDTIIERIRFDIIGVTESKHELRVWTDGDRVVWQDDEGRSGYMPLMLFRLAAFTLADRCEEEATRDDDVDDFREAWGDSLSTPIRLAACHPYWKEHDHEKNNAQFGFSGVAASTAIDADPKMLKERKPF